MPPESSGRRWILVYSGGNGRPAYTADDFRNLITVTDTTGKSTGWLMSGAILLEIRSATGRGFASWSIHPPANGADWAAYIDSILGPGGTVARLDSAVSVATGELGPPPAPFSVCIMIPYPDPAGPGFSYRGQSFNLSDPDQRLELVRRYVHEVRVRFTEAGYKHVRLAAFYWLDEGVAGVDVPFLPRVAAIAHAENAQFFWIPYYHAPGATTWRALGFDQAWYQPNYFFHPTVTPLRVDSAMRAADSLGMGIELELDDRLFEPSPYANRLLPYVVTLWLHPTLRARPVALYDGAGGLFKMARSKDARIRDEYRQLVAVLAIP